MFRIKKADAKEIIISEEELMYNALKKARFELKQATSTFNELSDISAVDYAAYNLLAAKAKYSYLLKVAKAKDMTL